MRKAMTALALVAAVGLVAQSAVAQGVRPLRFGVQGSYGTDNTNFAVGARVVYPALGTMLNVKGLEGYGSFDYFFGADDPLTYWEINPGVTYNVTLSGLTGVSPYIGAGLNIAHASVEFLGVSASDTQTGLNVLAGGRFALGKLSAFAEGRLELGGGELFVATFGILF